MLGTMAVIGGLLFLGVLGRGLWMANYARIHHPIQTRLKNFVQ